MLNILKERFEKNDHRHPNVSWDAVSDLLVRMF